MDVIYDDVFPSMVCSFVCSFRNVVSYYKQGISISRLACTTLNVCCMMCIMIVPAEAAFFFLRVLNSINSTRASLSLSLSLSLTFSLSNSQKRRNIMFKLAIQIYKYFSFLSFFQTESKRKKRHQDAVRNADANISSREGLDMESGRRIACRRATTSSGSTTRHSLRSPARSPRRTIRSKRSSCGPGTSQGARPR